MEEKKQIGFALQHIATTQFAILEENIPTAVDINLESGLNFGIDIENQFIGVFTKFIFSIENKPLLLIEVLCQFKISPEAWESFNQKKKIIVPKGFMMHLAMLTVGTARGVLHVKTENTAYNGFLLPTIDVTEMIKEDIIFTAETKESIQ